MYLLFGLILLLVAPKYLLSMMVRDFDSPYIMVIWVCIVLIVTTTTIAILRYRILTDFYRRYTRHSHTAVLATLSISILASITTAIFVLGYLQEGLIHRGTVRGGLIGQHIDVYIPFATVSELLVYLILGILVLRVMTYLVARYHSRRRILALILIMHTCMTCAWVGWHLNNLSLREDDAKFTRMEIYSSLKDQELHSIYDTLNARCITDTDSGPCPQDMSELKPLLDSKPNVSQYMMTKAWYVHDAKAKYYSLLIKGEFGYATLLDSRRPYVYPGYIGTFGGDCKLNIDTPDKLPQPLPWSDLCDTD